MRILLQRVKEASVTVDGQVVGQIGAGLLCFVCAVDSDTDQEIEFFSNKIAKLRIFSDSEGKLNKSIQDIDGSVLVVSQFTLAARWKKGNRPGFSDAAAPEKGERLYEALAHGLAQHGLSVETGRFGADMSVALINDGPITIWMDSEDPK